MATIKAGENLSTIAQNAGLTPAQFAALNPQFAGSGAGFYNGLSNNVAVGSNYNLAPVTPTPAVITADQANKATIDASNKLNGILTNNAQVQSKPAQSTPSTTINLGGEQKTVDPFESKINDINSSFDTEISKYNNLFEMAKQKLDTETNATVTQIQNMYAKRKDEMAATNKNALAFKRVSGIVSGRDRYAQDFQTDILSTEEREGIKRIADLDTEQEQLIAQAKNARDSKSMELLFSSMQRYDDLNKQKQDQISSLYKNAVEFEKIAIDKAKEARESIKADLDIQSQYADNIAASVLEQMTGDKKVDKEVVDSFASQYGIDSGFLNQAVSEYKLKQNQALPSDLREYEIMKQRGEYNGSFFNYLKTKKNAERVVGTGSKTSGGSTLSNKSLTQDEVERFNLPQSLLGKSDQSIIQDLTVSKVPAWFKDFVQQTEPDKQFDQTGWQSIWNNFRNTEDMAVYKSQFKINIPKGTTSTSSSLEDYLQ